MKFVNDFGINPDRGTSRSAGIDFFMPDPSRWSEEHFEQFDKYLKEQNLGNLLNYVNNISKVEWYTAILLWISWDYHGKEAFLSMVDDLKNGILTLKPRQSICVPTGIRTLFSPNYCGIFFNKSGRGKEGLAVKAQVIDEDYTGYVHINLVNTSDHPIDIKCGMKLSQLIELPVIYDTPVEISSEEYFNEMSNSERGDGAFGHTDV